MNAKKKLDNAASIEVNLTYAGKHAPLYMSSLYGSYLIETELSSTRKCDACGSQMIAFELKDGGQVQICSRRGCKKHVLEFQNADSELQAFYKSYLKAIK